jgi:hypothetical protein
LIVEGGYGTNRQRWTSMASRCNRQFDAARKKLLLKFCGGIAITSRRRSARSLPAENAGA